MSRAMDGIHISGVGLRLPPTLESMDDLWDHLLSRAPARGMVSEGLDGRRTVSPGESASNEGLIGSIDSFDPAPFGLSEHEATMMDPQQRLLLETAWESLADGGLAWDALQGSSLGVFVGAYAMDWLASAIGAWDDGPMDAMRGAGSSLTILANRLSYLLDARGPSLAVDTACASSLTALHLAVRALRAGECDRALVCGVALGHDDVFRAINASSLPMSSTDSLRPFDERADGIVRGEAVVCLLLERPEVSAGGRHGRILGTAVGHGGRTNGLTAPSRAGHVDVVRRALDDAGCPADRIQYLEAHGTGTPLGDPIEASALAEVFGTPGQICDMGSVKGTFGHTEAAAGIVGLLHAMLVARHGIVPAQAGFSAPNPLAGLENSGLRVSDRVRPVRNPSVPVVAAVSSLGFGGTIAHAVLSAPPAEADTSVPGSGEGHVLLTSAASADAVEHRRRALLSDWIDRGDDAVAASAVRESRVSSRTAFRGAWTGRDVAELRDDVVARAAPSDPAPRGRNRVLFLFSGQGSSWVEMGKELWDLPALDLSVERWEQEVHSLCGWSLRERVSSDPDRDTETTQICTFAVQLAVAELLSRRGIVPDAVLGHSMGDVTAAVVSGSIDLAAGFAALKARSATIEQHARGGRMASVQAPREAVAEIIGGRDDITVGLVNGPEATVISGAAEAVDEISAALRAHDVRVTPLPVDYAFHGPALRRDAHVDAPAVTRAPQIPWFSTVTGKAIGTPSQDFWTRTVSDTVLFAHAIEEAVTEANCRIVVEIAPRPVLTQHLVRMAGRDVTVIPTMASEQSPSEWLPRTVADLWLAGIRVPAGTLAGPGVGPGPVLAPAWRRRRLWPAGSGAPRADREAAERSVVKNRGRVREDLDETVRPAAERTPPTADAPSVREVAEFIATQAAPHVEGGVVDRLPLDVPLSEAEIPSLAVVTVRNAIESRFGLRVPLPVLLSGDSPTALARALGAVDQEPLAADVERLESTLARLDELSPDEIKELLYELD